MPVLAWSRVTCDVESGSKDGKPEDIPSGSSQKGGLASLSLLTQK